MTRAEKISKLRAHHKRATTPPPLPEIGAVMEDGSIFAGIVHGRKIFALPQDAETGVHGLDVMEQVAALNEQRALGHDDWRVPSRGELQLLFDTQNKGALKDTFEKRQGTRDPWYWSCTQPYPLREKSWVQNFATGQRFRCDWNATQLLRCVRRVKL